MRSAQLSAKGEERFVGRVRASRAAFRMPTASLQRWLDVNLETPLADGEAVSLDGLAELERHVFGDLTEDGSNTVEAVEYGTALAAGETAKCEIAGGNRE